MKTFKFEVTMKVSDSWIADGFQISDRIDQIEETIQGLLPYAYGHECVVKVKVTKEPEAKIIQQLQNGELEIKD